MASGRPSRTDRAACPDLARRSSASRFRLSQRQVAHGCLCGLRGRGSHALAPNGEARRFNALTGIASAGGSLACAGSPGVLTSHDLIALPLVLLAAISAALVARRAQPDSWPRSLLLIPVALGGWVAVVRVGMISNYVRWLYFQVDWALAIIPALALALWHLMRRPSIAPVVRAWVSAAFLFITLATMTTDEHGTVGLNGTAGLTACVAGRSSWLPGSVADVFADLLPNLALFAPLGYGLAALGWRWRRVIATAALLSLTIELYQALFTDRVCAPRDLFCNTLGAVVGAAVLLLVCAGPRRPPNDRLNAPDGEELPVMASAARTAPDIQY